MEKINTAQWQLLMYALLLINYLLAMSLVIILLAGTTGMNVSLPVSITLVFVGLMVLAIVLIVYFVHKWIKRKSMDLTTANTNDNVSHISEPNKEVKDEDTIGVRGVEVTPNPAQRTVACGNLEWQILACTLFVFFCQLTSSVVVIALAHYLGHGTDIVLPVSITLIFAGVMVLPIAFIVYRVLKLRRHNKQSSLTDPKSTHIHTYAYVCDHKEVSKETESGHSTCHDQGSEEYEIAARRVETTAIINPGYESTTPDMVDKYECELPELNGERTCDYLQESTDTNIMKDTYNSVYDPAIIEPNINVKCDYSTGVVSGEDQIAANPSCGFATCRSTTPDMVDKYDCELPELNEEWICDNPPQSADSKMIDTYDNVYDPAIVEPSREVEYNYLTGVGSGEDETAPRRVEMTVNPSYETGICKSSLRDPKNTDIHTYAYVCDHKEASKETESGHSTCQGIRSEDSEDEIAATRVETMAIVLIPGYGTVTSKSTTPDMVDEYDCELPELNEERTCDYLQESTNPKMTNTYDNVYDPAIIEPNGEVVYDYSRSSGVGSEEDKIAATPSYGIATCKSTTPDMVDEYDYEFPELNEEWTWDTTSQSTVPELIDTYDNVYDSAIIEPNIEVACGYPTDVGSGEHEVEATKVEFTILDDWILK